MPGRVAGRLASAAEIGPNVEALVAATQQIQVVADFLVQLAAEANVDGIFNVGDGLSLRARGVGRAAVRLCKLLRVPWYGCNDITWSALLNSSYMPYNTCSNA